MPTCLLLFEQKRILWNVEKSHFLIKNIFEYKTKYLIRRKRVDKK